jgi:L-ascorbate metabolism protein UlaG (beta-lactamase superfamily)
MTKLHIIPFDQPLAAKLAEPPGKGVSLYWLGQAGFVIDAGGKRIVIDPYLSDSLAVKYRETPYSHERMAPAPVTPDDLGAVDLVLCTHHHTDHMDGETLHSLAIRLPDLKFVVPAASIPLAMQRIGVGADRLIAVDAGEWLEAAGIGIHVLPAAHETLERDDQGHHKFLGYGLTLDEIKIFHSGDTIPFEGQDEQVRNFAPDLALLPVNGRSEALARASFAGNFTLFEAIALCEKNGIGRMIAHHYGMFAFNTISLSAIEGAAAKVPFQLEPARFQRRFVLDAPDQTLPEPQVRP